MWRWFLVLHAIAFLGVVASAQDGPLGSKAATEARKSFAADDIRGVWKVTELASRSPGAGWEVRETPCLSQYIFTDKHYSYMYVPGSGPRKRFSGDPNNPTDAERAQAYSSLVAATGIYSLSGQTLTLNALVHKNPNEMTGVPLTYTVDVDGNSLQMITVDPPFLPGHEWRTVLTRIE